MTRDNNAALSGDHLRLRFDRDFGLHRIRNEALLVGGMIHLFDLLRGGLLVAGELQSLVQSHTRNSQLAFRIFFHMADRVVAILVEHELLFACDGKERQHVATRKRRYKRFLRIDKLWVSEISGGSRCLHFVSTVKIPSVIARIFLILERRVAAFPGESNFMFGHAFR